MNTDHVLAFSEPGSEAHWLRPHPVRPHHVDLQVTIDLAARSITGVVEHHCEVLDVAATTLELDCHELGIDQVLVDGSECAFALSPGKLLIILPVASVRCVVRIAFHVSHPAKGMYFIDADAQARRVQMCWTQGAMEDHSWWFPCLDSPNNLSTYRISIRHPAALRALSNGNLQGSTSGTDGWTTTVYSSEKPYVLYLLNVVVGDFIELSESAAMTSGTAVPLQHYLPRGCAAQGEAMFRATAFALDFLSTTIGVAYPWPAYGHVVVHGFMWGGMENTGLTTISDRFLMDREVQQREQADCDALVVHELVHQWFGDLLTMKGWADIWLNESFATYFEARGAASWIAHREGGGPQRYEDELALHQWADRRAYFEEDQGRYRRALVTNRYADAYELFDRVAYEKGSLVLHHLCSVLGERRFHKALALYVTRHAHGLVETPDFRQAIEDASGEPLDWFFAQWVYRPGHPRLKVRWHYDPSRRQLLLSIEQAQASSGEVQTTNDRLYRLPSEVWYQDGDTVQRQRIELTQVHTQMVLPCGVAPQWMVVDPYGTLLCEWDEEETVASLMARLHERRLPAYARARAAVNLGSKVSSPQLIASLRQAAADATTAELVRGEALCALGSLAARPAVDALCDLHDTAALPPRLRRMIAQTLGRQRGIGDDARLAEWLMAKGDADSSEWCAGEWYAARGALEHPGATPLLRQRLRRESWNQRVRLGCIRGLGLSGEIVAIDEVAGLMAQDHEHDSVLTAACEAAGRLASRVVMARVRMRPSLERRLDHPSMAVRCAAARALAVLGDTESAGALARRLSRELFGNVRRVLREALAQMARTGAHNESLAKVMARLDDSERARARLETRLDALEKRLAGGPS